MLALAGNLAYGYIALESDSAIMSSVICVFFIITALFRIFWYKIISFLGLSKNKMDSCTAETNLNQHEINAQTNKNNLNHKQLRKRTEKQSYIIPTYFFSALFINYKEHTKRNISTVLSNRYYNTIASED